MTYKPQMVKPIYALDTVLEFGAHRGEKIKDIPGDYLLWMIYNLTNAEFTTKVYELAQDYADNNAEH